MSDSAIPNAPAFVEFYDLFDRIPFPEWKSISDARGTKNHPWHEVDAIFWRCTRPNNELPEEVRIWFRERGWLASSLKSAEDNVALFAPVVYVPTPTICFHTTKASLLPMVQEHGLLPACRSGQSTTNRPDCRHFIHVTRQFKDAEKWVKDDLLGKGNAGVSWVILSLDLRDAGLVLFRDPFSQTGLITDTDQIDWRFVRETVAL